MNFDKYKNKLKYPKIRKLSDTDRRILEKYNCTDAIARAVAQEEADRQLRKTYNQEGRRLEDLFKKDALADVGLTDHPKADRIFSKAWEQGHSGGYSEVHSYLVDLADLFQDN